MADEEYFDEEDGEELEEQKPGPIRRFLQNLIIGSALGAGIGGAGGYYGAKYLRDLKSYGMPPNSYIPEYFRDRNNPVGTTRAVTVPAGILVGGLLGAVGGATLPYIFQKGAELENNKYANQFLSSLKNQIKQLRPFDQADATIKLMPVGIAAGSLAGGLIGAIKDPGTNEDGTPKSRSSSILRGMGIGGGLGGLSGLAVPTVGALAAQNIFPSVANKLQEKYRNIGTAKSLTNVAILDAAKQNIQHVLPQMTVSDFANLVKVLKDNK